MALLTAQPALYPSFVPVLTAANLNETCQPGDDVRLIVRNASGGSINVTITSFPDTSPWGTAVSDLVVAVPAGQDRWIGPLRGSAHADPITGLVGITYSAVTSVTAALVQD